ncbi:MAG: ABC transporter ATP-binding protein [Candidatus Sericytochromatia bacterium]|nr:ABC transporter ATP-binding protein [Candidatus Sericytochromatia bacterium]
MEPPRPRPEPDHAEEGLAAPAVLSIVAAYLRPHARWLCLAAALVVGGTAAAAAMVPLARGAAEAFSALTLRDLNLVVAGAVGLFALRGALSFGQAVASSHVALAVTAQLREDAFARLLQLDEVRTRGLRPAELTTRLTTDLDRLREALAAVLAELVPSILIIAYALGSVFVLNWRLALATLIGAPIVGFAIARFGHQLHALAGEGQARVAEVAVRTQETLTALGLVRAFGREAEELERFVKASQDHRQALWRAAWLGAAQSPVVATLQAAALGGVLWVGGWEILEGRLQPPDLLAFAAAIGIAVDPTLAVSHAWSRIQVALASARRVCVLLTVGPLLQADPGAAQLGPVSGGLTLTEVDFAYPGGPPVLERVSLVVPPGEHLAVAGRSGSGKSTLAALLVRLTDPSGGEVALDGRRLSGIRPAELRRAVALVPQHPMLFAATVAQNLRFGWPGASEAELWRVLRLAQAEAFVRALPEGLETIVGEGGAGLSGGQCQRLAIARALLVDPVVLVLDEATSALDPATDAALREALRLHRAGRTTIWVAHRSAWLEQADRVVVLDGGRIVQAGPPAHLRAREGPYRRLLLAARDLHRHPER